MIILPAIDLFHGQAVRLLRGNYDDMTIYDADPVNTALKFKSEGAQWIHIVDLEGARLGEAVNFEAVLRIKEACGLKCEVGGGIRDMKTIERYVSSGVDRVILGTSAVTVKNFAADAVKEFGSDKIAVGVDIKKGSVAIKGWTENSELEAVTFCQRMQDDGITTIISTDISRDGAMNGTNLTLYRTLSEKLSVNIIASGGISSLDDIWALSQLGLYGAIIGKAYYTEKISIKRAIKEADA